MILVSYEGVKQSFLVVILVVTNVDGWVLFGFKESERERHRDRERERERDLCMHSHFVFPSANNWRGECGFPVDAG